MSAKIVLGMIVVGALSGLELTPEQSAASHAAHLAITS